MMTHEHRQSDPPTIAPNHLPVPTNAFIGREEEVQAVLALLRRPQTRLVTLTGPGGTGKTRISLHIGSLLFDAYTDGVFFVELAPLSSPDQVIQAIAATLHLYPDDAASLDELLPAYLASKQMLLILDNFEQVIDAASQVAELLEAAQDSQFLVSSRQLLHIPEETEFRVPPFPVPDAALLPPCAELARNPAVAIFVQRAQHVEPFFALTETNAAFIVAICTRLDGLPLAIELAASRVRQFPPEALLAQLDHSLMVLTRGGRDRSERQQTLRGLIAWSYDLLSVGEQALFGRIGVFAGSFSLAAAEAICNLDGDLPMSVAEGLAALTDKNLLRVRYGADGTARYSMLNTLREYACYVLERLAPEAEAETIRQRYIAYYQAIAVAAIDTGPLGPTDPTGVITQLEQEHENLLAAFDETSLPQTGDTLHLGRCAGLHIKCSQMIDCPPAEVFAYIENIENIGTWLPFVQSVRITSAHKRGLGVTADMVGQAMNRRTEMTAIVTEYRPGQILTLQSTSGTVAFRTGFTLESVGRGTRLTITSDLDVSNIFKVVRALATAMLRRTLDVSLLNIKNTLENKKA